MNVPASNNRKKEVPNKPITNKSKKVSLKLNENKVYDIEFINEINYLSITAQAENELFPIKYQNKFTLEDISNKVKFFRDYESVDECLFEIFEGLDSTKTVLKEENGELNIVIPLATKNIQKLYLS